MTAEETFTNSENAPAKGTVSEVFRVFLGLGLTSFGGPVAHLGYFRTECVTKRKWLDEAAYADIVALCQFLPGPASSQTGFALGFLRAGLPGALAAFLAFTLPSALFLTLAAIMASQMSGPIGAALTHGLKIVAVAIVAQAVYGMARTLTPDRPRAAIALLALGVVTILPGSIGQMAAILGGLALGLAFCRSVATGTAAELPLRISGGWAAGCLVLFAVLLLLPGFLATTTQWTWLGLFDAFYHAGALVFGGGHVVLPLLETAFVAGGRVSADSFLTGYGLAQIVPGPLFTFASYLGAATMEGAGTVAGAVLGTVAIFLPGFLLLVGILPFWHGLRLRPGARAAMAGVNAAVVGLLAAALYSPVWTNAIRHPADFAIAAAGFILLVVWKLPPWIVVIMMVSVSLIAGLTGNMTAA